MLINHRSGYSESEYRFIKINNPLVSDNISGSDRLSEYNTLQSTASAERHIKLALFEGATSCFRHIYYKKCKILYINYLHQKKYLFWVYQCRKQETGGPGK